MMQKDEIPEMLSFDAEMKMLVVEEYFVNSLKSASKFAVWFYIYCS
jgi:hypothetical protein